MIRRVAAIAIVGVAAACVAVVVLLYGPLPSRRGVVEIEGLTAPVEVRFDRAGVPHVASVLEADAWRVLGWLHASERLFQMEMRRRAACGRLAEVFGAALVPVDVEARTWGHLRGATADLAALPERDRSVLEAYASGVNAFIDAGPLPLELQLLHVDPEPWTPLDSLAFGRRMYQGLTVAGAEERAVFADALARGIDAAVADFDASDGGRTAVAPEIKEGLSPFSSRNAHTSFLEEKGDSPSFDRDEAAAGSNAWALAGSRTASGAPLLAGDPHLNAERPGTWYAAHLASADGLAVAGLTLAGVPGVIIGHNGKVAWSITMTQADDIDYVLERDADVTGAREESVRVAGGDPVAATVREGRHGPIVDEVQGGFALARAWMAAELRHGIGFHLAAARAADGAELRRAWSSYLGPAINLCWADRRGSIGVGVFGAIPHRRLGDGRFPVPGWIDGYGWDGVVPAQELPQVVNPPEGFVATANDDWSAVDVRPGFPGLWASSDRVLRARDLASRLSRADVHDMRTMQGDVYSRYAARVVAALAGVRLEDARAVAARTVLASWDKTVTRRGPARLFFAFLRRVRGPSGSGDASGTAGAWSTWSRLDRMIAGTADAAMWDDPRTPQRETREAAIEAALRGALDDVEREGGTDPRRWSWGRVHRLSYPHPLAAGLPALLARRLAFRAVELPGEWHTLDVAGFRLRGDDFDVVHIPSARLVVDLANPDASRLCLPLGQSGQVLDRHAKDQQRRWAVVSDIDLPFSEKAVLAATVSTMTFVPPAAMPTTRKR